MTSTATTSIAAARIVLALLERKFDGTNDDTNDPAPGLRCPKPFPGFLPQNLPSF